jgi:DNA-binding MarR family transcriptional regulator
VRKASDRASVVAHELRVVLGQLTRRLRSQSNKSDLSLSQLAVLGTLDREGTATVTALARNEGVRSQSMGATVAALQEAGLVDGAPDPADGRQVMLSLTEAARALIKANRAAREDWLSQAIRSHLTSAQQHELAAVVRLLRRIVDE